MWPTTRSRLPPEPWSTSTAAPLREGTHQADNVAPVGRLDRHLVVRDRQRRLLDRPARRVGDQQHLRERHQPGQHEHRADEPARGVQRAVPAARAGRGGERGHGGAEQQHAAEDHPDARQVAPVGAGVDDVQPVRDDAEADREQAHDEPEREPRRADQARLQREPGGRERQDREHAPPRRGGAGDREVEQVRGDEREPARQERALQAGEPAAPPRPRRGGGPMHGRAHS